MTTIATTTTAIITTTRNLNPNHQNHNQITNPQLHHLHHPGKEKQKRKSIRTTKPHRSTYQTTIKLIEPPKHRLNHRKSDQNPTQLPQANPREGRGTRYSEKFDFCRKGAEEMLGMKAWVIGN